MLLREDFAKIINYIFSSLLVLYLLLLLFSQLFDIDANRILSLDYLFIITILFGVLFIFANKSRNMKEDESSELKILKKNSKEYNMESYSDILSENYSWLVYFLGVLAFFLVKLRTYALGGLSWIISITVGMLIILISLLILEENKNE